LIAKKNHNFSVVFQSVKGARARYRVALDVQREKTSAAEKAVLERNAVLKEAEVQLKRAKERKRTMMIDLSVTEDEISKLEKIARIQK
jgi:hypothetical protein